MGNVYFDYQSEGVRTTRDQVSERTRDEDYPYKFCIENLPFVDKHGMENLVQTRRWGERNLVGDIYFNSKWLSKSGRIFKYYWEVYFENSEDAVLCKLKWNEYVPPNMEK